MLQIPIVDTNRSRQNNPPVLNWRRRIETSDSGSAVRDPFTLEELIGRVSGLKKRTALLGQTLEGLPLFFGLEDTSPSSILVVSDHAGGKTALTMTMAASLARLNKPEEVRFAVVTSRPDEWAGLETLYPAHFMKIASSSTVEAENLIYHLCDLVEGRQNGMHVGTSYMLIFDGMEMLQNMDVDLQANYEWLVRCGSQQQIWPLSTLNTESIQSNFRLADLFRTRIIGTIDNPQTAARFMPPRLYVNPHDGAVSRFTVRIHQHWLQFRIPDSLG